MILRQINGTEIDLSVSTKFMEFASQPFSMSRLIVDQFNGGKFPEIPKGRTFLDIGGNVGLFSIFVAPFYDKVLMIEPTPEHVEVAKDLIDKLGLSNKIEIIQMAYWPFNDVIDLNVGTANSTMNSISHCGQVHQGFIEVDCVNLQSLFEDEDIDFIKMDIEGAENDVVKSEDFLKYVPKAKRLLMEVHSFPDLQLENIRKNLEYIKCELEEVGMKVISDERDELYMRSPLDNPS